MRAISTFLMFNDRAEEAVRFYVSVFPNSRIVELRLADGDSPIAKGKVHQAIFELNGERFSATDGGPDFSFSMGTSLWVPCDSQGEIDTFSEKLISGGGQQMDCGWVEDRFGVYWQIVPANIDELMLGADRAAGKRAFDALMKMQKIDVATLERAAAGKESRAA